MRYKVKQIESVEFVIEGKNEDEIKEWLSCNTIKEIRMINNKINPLYKSEIIEKTVYPADITVDDYCEDIVDEINWENKEIRELNDEQ